MDFLDMIINATESDLDMNGLEVSLETYSFETSFPSWKKDSTFRLLTTFKSSISNDFNANF